MKVFNGTTKKIFLASWVLINQTENSDHKASQLNRSVSKPYWDILQPLRQWIDSIQVCDRQLAHHSLLNLKASRVNDQHSSLNPKVSSVNARHSALNLKASPLNLKASCVNDHHSALNLRETGVLHIA